MKLLDYLEPMETLPNRFSNLAFWRVLRVFKDKIVDAFTYVNAWGTDIETEQKTQNASLTSHGQMIDDIKEEQITQNGAIESLEKSKESVDGRVTTLESGQKALNEAIESVEKEQSTQGGEITSLKGDVSEIQAEQITQNTNIGSNTTSIESLQTSVAEVADSVNALKPLVYDGGLNFKTTTYTVTGATITEVGSGTGIYVINYPTQTYNFPAVPYNVVFRASIYVYNNEEKTNYSSVYINLPYFMGTSGGSPYIMFNTGYFYAPLGVKSLVGVYVTYNQHV